MRSVLFLGMMALCSVLFHLSDGTQPEESIPNMDLPCVTAGTRYSVQEERFIIDELISRGSAYKSSSTWREIAEAHKRKRESQAVGFFKDRTAIGLNDHFFKVMLRGKSPNGSVIVPGSLKKAIKSTKYTRAEDEFINAALMSSTVKHLHDRELWEDIALQHELKVQSGATGFNAERTSEGLRTHFYQIMMPKNRVPEAVIQKFLPSSSAARNQKRIPKNVLKYTQAEDDFINTALLSSNTKYLFEQSVWEDIAMQHYLKLISGATGFIIERTAEGLRAHFHQVMIPKNRVREDLIQKYQLPSQTEQGEKKILKNLKYTEEEHDLINAAVFSSDAEYAKKPDLWKSIALEHDLKRESGAKGFVSKRTAQSIRTHFNNVMRPHGWVSKDVIQKRPLDAYTEQSGSSQHVSERRKRVRSQVNFDVSMTETTPDADEMWVS